MSIGIKQFHVNSKIMLAVTILLLYSWDMDTKLSFTFTEEDMEAIRKIQAKMSKEQGKVSNIAAVRLAIRKAAK